MNCVRHRIEVINNRETWLFAEIVDAGDIDQVVERKFIPAEFRDLTKIVCSNHASHLTTKFSLVLDLLRKRTVERFECFPASHSYAVIGQALRLPRRSGRQAERLTYNSSLRRTYSCERSLEPFCEFRFLISE